MSRVSLSDLVPGGQPEPSNRRGSARAKERRKKRKRRRSWLVLFMAFLVLGGAGAGAYYAISPIVRSALEPNDFTGAGAGAVTVTVAPGATGATIGTSLFKAGVVKTAEAFVDVAKQNPDSASIRPGTYRLKTGMSASAALEALLDPATRVERKVTIAEGKRVAELPAVLAKGLGIPEADFKVALKDPTSYGLPASAKGNPEGYLFPATYTFAPDATAVDVLTSMVRKTRDELQAAGVSETEAHSVLTIASLVQAESGSEKYMDKMARVVLNRLKIKRPLQLDTTVHYATGRFTLKTTFADLKVNSPYNTYLRAGLPPGPICAPGAAAFKAVRAPAAGTWIYFTTVDPDTGETKFATTLAEKATMDAEFRAWQKLHPNE